MIAIVGTRKATHEGLALARKISGELANAGASIVSGLAYGIDAAAHEAALEKGGKTYAVLAHGLHQVYPPSHTALAHRITEGHGALVSPYSPGTPAVKHNFLERNAIVSGMCRCVVIIEAPFKSGTISTARHALDQGREVFVVPHSPLYPSFQGSLELLRQGARLVRHASDILEDLGLLETLKITQNKLPLLPQNASDLLHIIETHPGITIDKLTEILNVDVQIIQQNISKLVIEGLITDHNTHYTKL